MNFFQAQDQARRKTWQLALLFVVAVVVLIVLTNLLLLFAYLWTPRSASIAPVSFSHAIQDIPWDTWVWVSIGVIGTVTTASVYKFLSIRGGGRTIAESLGGGLIHQNTSEPKQRRLLNVVEEMAIAAGVSVPPVYLIPESSINAFAAGFGPNDAVIGINQGTLDILNRSELQGVVAHEFSHILNGDTGINLRLIAVLHGILFIGMIGYGVMRAGGFQRRNGLPIVIVGIGLLVIGYGGTFFGNLIKAAVSRQREFLADASAVQFTRDPGGIADALKKIGGANDRSYLTNPAAEEASHMFFGAAAKKFAGNLFATHPSLPQRIIAIEPNWDGAFVHSNSTPAPTPGLGTPGVSQMAGAARQANEAETLVASIGRPTQASLTQAAKLVSASEDRLIAAAHDAHDAQALIYTMIINQTSNHGGQSQVEEQLAYLTATAGSGITQLVRQLLPAMNKTSASGVFILLEASMPALKELSYPQYKSFNQTAAELITLDKQIDLFEWVLHRILVKDLYGHFEGPQSSHGRIKNIHKVASDVAKLLSIIASHGHSDLSAQLHAYETGAKNLNIDIAFAKQEQFNFQRMNETLASLRKLHPLTKPALLKACVATAVADEQITDSEYALLQGISATLDCPLPARVDQV